MIEGLKIDIKAAELQKLLVDRLNHNKERLAYWQAQRKHIETAMGPLAEEVKDAYSKLGSSSQSPLTTADNNIANHRKQILFYGFTSEHLVQDETYRLSEDDLSRIGISPNRW